MYVQNTSTAFSRVSGLHLMHWGMSNTW